jgi:DNA-directed RNA polymerase subunit L
MPKINDTIPGEQLKLTAEFSVSSARVNSMFNVVSKCAYGNTLDLVKINEKWLEVESKLRSQELTNEDIEFQKKNYYLLDAQRIFVEDSFDFIIQTVGVFDNKYIVKKAIEILFEKFTELIHSIDSDIILILNSETTMSFCYDILLENEDYTMGKVIEYILYEKYYVNEKTLDYCGFKKFHPHDTTSTIRIAFSKSADKTDAKTYMRNACIDAQDVFKNLARLF